MFRALLVLSIAPVVFVLGSCASKSSDAPACTEYTTTADLKTPTVSFKTNVMPFLERGCMFSGCHGAGSSKGDLKMVKGDSTATRISLVGVAAPQLPSMKLVEPGDWKKSYVMKKVDGDICLLTAQCIAPCGDTMPQGNDLLETGERDTLRRWIAQGAGDN